MKVKVKAYREHVGFDTTRCNAIDSDASFAEICSKSLDEANDTRERFLRETADFKILLSCVTQLGENESQIAERLPNTSFASTIDVFHPLLSMGKHDRDQLRNAPELLRSADGELHVVSHEVKRTESVMGRIAGELCCPPTIESRPHQHSSRRRSASSPPSRGPLNDLVRTERTREILDFGDALRNDSRYNTGHCAAAATHMLKYGEDITNSDIKREALYLIKQGIPLKKSMIRIFTRHMRYSKHFDVTQKLLARVLLPRQAIVSAGYIPHNEAAIKEAEARDAEAKRIAEAWGKKKKEAEVKKQNRKERQQIEKLKEAKAYKPHTLIDDLNDVEKHKQNTKTYARLHVDPNPDVKRHMQITVEQNYIDPVREGQPAHCAKIFLTEANARTQYATTFTPDAYKYQDVTNSIYLPVLQMLFPHAEDQVHKYFAKLQLAVVAPDRLVLIEIPYNAAPWTSNIFAVSHEAALFSSLSFALRRSTTIFMLAKVPMEVAETLLRDTFLTFAQNCTWDPLTRLFTNPMQIYLDQKAVVTDANVLSFKAPILYTFEDWMAFKIRVGLASFLEFRHSVGTHHYSGSAIIVNVPQTYFARDLVCLTLCMSVLLDEDDVDSKMPRLSEGDKVTVQICPQHDGSTENPFVGTVSARTHISQPGEVTIFVNRPTENGRVQDTRVDFISYNSSISELDAARPSQLLVEARQATRYPVRITRVEPANQLKQLAEGFKRLDISKRSLLENDPNIPAIEAIRNLFIANDIQNLPRRSIADFLSLSPEDEVHFVETVRSHLRDYQVPFFNSLCDEGVLANTAVLGGPSGTGKTQVITLVASLFLGKVRITESRIESRTDKLTNHFKKPKPKKKDITDATGILGGEGAEEIITGPDGEENGTHTNKDAQDEDEDEDAPPAANAFLPEHFKTGKDRIQSRTTQTATDGALCEQGRILIVAVQNDTVDKMYLSAPPILKQLSEELGIDQPLIMRYHSRSTEVRLAISMVHFAFEESQTNPSLRELPPQVTNGATNRIRGSNSDKFLEVFANTFLRSKWFKVYDKRVVDPESSVARYVIELALPEALQSPELKRCFSSALLTELREVMKPLAQGKMRSANGRQDHDPEHVKSMKVAVHIAIDHLLMNAPVIITTAFSAKEHRFNTMRDSHCVVIEEGTRLREAELVSLFSAYPDAFKLVSGDHRQLSPAIFGDKRQNPFWPQLKLTSIARWIAVGFPVFEFKNTYRFRNAYTLKIAQIANNMPDLIMGEGCEESVKLKAMSDLSNSIWKINKPCIFIDVEEFTVAVDNTKSSYNVNTARVALHDAYMRAKSYSGSEIVIISPYNAQTSLHEQMKDALLQRAEKKGRTNVVEQLRQIKCRTIDADMGDESDHVVLDTLAMASDHTMDRQRIDVAYTRPRISMTIVGNAKVNTSTTDKYGTKHPQKKIIRWLLDNKWVHKVTEHSFKKMYPFTELLEALNIQMASPDGTNLAALTPSGPDVIPYVFIESEEDPEDVAYWKSQHATGAQDWDNNTGDTDNQGWQSTEDADNQGWKSTEEADNQGWQSTEDADNLTKAIDNIDLDTDKHKIDESKQEESSTIVPANVAAVNHIQNRSGIRLDNPPPSLRRLKENMYTPPHLRTSASTRITGFDSSSSNSTSSDGLLSRLLNAPREGRQLNASAASFIPSALDVSTTRGVDTIRNTPAIPSDIDFFSGGTGLAPWDPADARFSPLLPATITGTDVDIIEDLPKQASTEETPKAPAWDDGFAGGPSDNIDW